MLVTSSQPQLYPPPYLISRFTKAEILIWLTQAQHKRSQFMSELYLWDSKRQQKVGVSLQVVKYGRPWVSDVAISQPENFRLLVIKELERLYRDSLHLSDAIEFFEQTYCPHPHLVPCCIETFKSTIKNLGLLVDQKWDISIIPVRPENASQWLSNLTRLVGGTEYFQGRKAMESYFELDKFEGLKVRAQHYVLNTPSNDLSVLHYVATYGLPRTQAICQPNMTMLVNVKGSE